MKKDDGLNIIGIIFARGGSKQLPGKNIKPFAGKPLIEWAIENALSVKNISRVIVSTDSEKISEIAKACGAEVPFIRPKELATDEASEWLAWQHALKFLLLNEGHLPDLMVSIPTTAPLRLPIDIENCIECYKKGKFDGIVTVTPSHRNPYFNMIEISSEGLIKLAKTQENFIQNRQKAPKTYDMTTVAYAFDPKYVISATSMMSGKLGACLVPAERSIDIDTLLDFQIAEFLFDKRDKDG